MTDQEKMLAVELPTKLILNLDLFTNSQLDKLISSMEVELRERHDRENQSSES